MKKDLDDFYEDIGYEEGFILSNVKPSMQRKRLFDIHVIVGDAISTERKEIFGEDIDSSPHFHFF